MAAPKGSATLCPSRGGAVVDVKFRRVLHGMARSPTRPPPTTCGPGPALRPPRRAPACITTQLWALRIEPYTHSPVSWTVGFPRRRHGAHHMPGD